MAPVIKIHEENRGKGEDWQGERRQQRGVYSLFSFLTPSPLAAPQTRTPFNGTPRGYTSAAAAAAAPRAPAEKNKKKQMLCYAVWLFLPFLRQTHHR